MPFGKNGGSKPSYKPPGRGKPSYKPPSGGGSGGKPSYRPPGGGGAGSAGAASLRKVDSGFPIAHTHTKTLQKLLLSRFYSVFVLKEVELSICSV